MIAKLRQFVPRNILLHIYQSLIHPHVSYGLTAWGMASKTALNRILILQKRCLRLYFFQKVELMLSHYFSIPAFCLSICNTMKECAALCTMSITNSHLLTSQISSLKLATCILIIRVPLHLKIIIKNFLDSKYRTKLSLAQDRGCGLNFRLVYMRSLPMKTFKIELHNLLLSVLEQCDDYLDIDQITFALKKSN